MRRFSPGDNVRTRNVNPDGHTRLPQYLAGRRGVIESVLGVFALADDRARGASLENAVRETLYTVIFEANELWKEGTAEPLAVSADLWDSYLMKDETR
jgi:nitrile hydratase subunit beta